MKRLWNSRAMKSSLAPTKCSTSTLSRLPAIAPRVAKARGLDEAVTWSFLPEAQANALGGGAWTLANPISEELKVMRPSLVLTS